MSNVSNELLHERAWEMISYWEGTIIARAIEEDINRSDLEALRAHTVEAEAMASQEEFENADIA